MENINTKPCLKRWWRHLTFIPFLHRNWLNKTLQDNLSKKVTASEAGHRGEVFLIIEARLPVHIAYRMTTRKRALDLFTKYHVWDTEENTGILVYVNICEHQLEIIADRGINKHVSKTVWQAMCDKTTDGLAVGNIEASLSTLLDEISQLLLQYHKLEHDPEGNELSDAVIYLK